MVSYQHHWELMKMESIDDSDTNEFGLLDQIKNELEDLIEDFGIAGSSSVNDAGSVGGNMLSSEGSNGMTFGVSSSNASTNSLSPNNILAYSDAHMLLDQKPQIRHDCMWAGMCRDQSHPEKNSHTGCGSCAHQNRHQLQSTASASTGSLTRVLSKDIPKSGGSPIPVDTSSEQTKSGATGGGGSALLNSTIPHPACSVVGFKANNPSQTSLLTPFKATQSSAQIPAGSSLLIKRQQQQQQQQQLSSVMLSQNFRQLPLSPSSSDSSSSTIEGSVCEVLGAEQNVRVVRVPPQPRGSFLATREQEARSVAAQNHARPDTPLSLDDDPLEFKHNLDLVATCTIGSNQQSLLNTSSSPASATNDEEDDEDDEEEEGEEEDEDEDESDEDEEKEDNDEVDEEDEEDANDGSIYGGRSRIRNSHRRYHSQLKNLPHLHHRRAASRVSYRPYDVEAYKNGKKQKKQTSTNLLSNGGVNTIIAGNGASLKSSILGTKTATSCSSGNGINATSSSTGSQQPENNTSSAYHATHFGDHSYTRPKGGYNMNELGVQTPSDS
uniref:Uncharacterized protein n=1 Tax=Anopheles christyi TaxID=43041 RepID=A0A182JZW2_9DIPT